ncbi:hypothetical protein BMF94_2476 [Rhodotorula taiwanensis]|uniref:Uncharacterized protein n=1 Tax=Rhodotorula taiwanensis TaxID=741276 RepID=A0A2S5BCI7_9BASI|nr:hypothetical protein BMF94_2476 [Rhodotorula taiwanensis]
MATSEVNKAAHGRLEEAVPHPRIAPTLSTGLLDRLKAQRRPHAPPASAPAPDSPHPPRLVSPPLQPFASPRMNLSSDPISAFPGKPAGHLSPLDSPHGSDLFLPVRPGLPPAARQDEQQPTGASPLSTNPSVAHEPHSTYQASLNDKGHGDESVRSLPQACSTLDPLESGSPSIDYEQILAQGWLLLPPLDRPMTDGLLAFNDLWTPAYALLTPHDLTVRLEDGSGSPSLAFEVAEVVSVERLSKHERSGFEPFCVSLVDGSHFFAAASDHLGGAFWALKIE